MGRKYIEPMPAEPLAPSKPSVFARLLARCPGQCAICHAWSPTRICSACLVAHAQIARRCPQCAIRLPDASPLSQCAQCQRHPPPLDLAIAALDYAFPWNQLLQRYKFHQGLELCRPLLDRLDNALDEAQAEMPDWLLAVPLSQDRLRERGYNQSHELARALAARRGLRCDAGLLLRLRQGQAQSSLPLPDRAANVKHSFAVEPGRLPDLRGAHVALLDDVMTTGATLFELARVVRQAGAVHVQAWVLARTPAQ